MRPDVLAGLALGCLLVCFLAIPLIQLWFKYSRWWHRFRKYQYRIIQSTIMSKYDDDPRTYFMIQKKGWFGWKDRPDLPGYCSGSGKFSIYRSTYYDSLEEAQGWLDMNVAIMTTDGEKRTVRG